MHVFMDMDGVILDSEATIKNCYREAGIDPPENLFEMEGKRWMPVDKNWIAIKKTKDRLYAEAIRQKEVNFLDPWLAAIILSYTYGHRVHLLTGAGYCAISALYSVVQPVWPFTIASGKLMLEEKMSILGAINGPWCYIDDQPIDVSNWVPSYKDRFIHYQGQSKEELLGIIERSV